LIIRKANIEDAAAISSLILNTAENQLRHEFSDEGWRLFERLLSRKTQASLIDNKKFNYFLAISQSLNSDEQLLGVLAIKDKNHLFHFFVKPECQSQGVGHKLWQTFLQVFNSENYSSQQFKEITVNSSDFALSFYQKLGFVMKTTRQQKNGVCYTPMIYCLEDSTN